MVVDWQGTTAGVAPKSSARRLTLFNLQCGQRGGIVLQPLTRPIGNQWTTAPDLAESEAEQRPV